jgi:hypothetical protein
MENTLLKLYYFRLIKNLAIVAFARSHILSSGVTIDQVESVFSRVADCVIVLPAI